MNPLAALLVAFIAAASLDAAGVTIEMVPGTAPQTAHSGAFFLEPLSVIVRDDSGAPMAGTTVQFVPGSSPEGRSVMFLGGGGVVSTDANGLATVGRVVALGPAGDVNMRVVQAQATIDLPPLTIVGTPPQQMAYMSGANQYVYPGSVFGQGFAVKALDADGFPVPYAFVMYSDAHLDGWAYSTFDGAFDATAMADAYGVASLRATAGPVLGTGAASACGFGMPCTTFYYTVVARVVPTTAEPWGIPPLSLERGTSSVTSFVVTLRDQNGEVMPGAQATYHVDPTCGSFLGSASATVSADGIGRAISPPVTALSSEVYCRITLEVSPTLALTWDIYEFSADHVVVGDLPASLALVPGQPFRLAPTFTADGVGIYPLPISVDITAAPNGASATLVTNPIASFDSNRVNLYFNANGRSGHYTITLRRGPVQATVEVKQNGK